MRATTIALYALPFATALVVGLALFVVGAPRAFEAARLYGGPTEDARRLTWRIALVETYRGVEAPLTGGAVELEARFDGGQVGRWSGELDELGMAAASIDVPGAPLATPPLVRVTRGGQIVAEGRVWLSIADWSSRSRRRGGFYGVQSKGELTIRVAPGRGALAVPFADPIWIEVRRDGAPVAGAQVHVEPEGMRMVVPKSADEVVLTDASGRARIVVAPFEHALALRVAVEHDGKRAHWYASLPIVPGALSASMQAGRLRIQAPVVRSVAFFAITTERARLAGGSVRLEPDGRGGAVQLVDLPRLPEGPVWAVVSSEPELASDTTVGWPLRVDEHARGEPPTTFEAPDRLLLEGLSRGAQRESEKRQRARMIAGGFTLVALLLASFIVIARARSADTQLRAHLEAAGEEDESRDRIAQRRVGLRIAIAVLCIALGFAVIALVALHRLG